jgi:hypothetical protein
MRHLGSLLLAIVLAPIVYLLTGVGLSAFGQAAGRGIGERPTASLLSIATLAVAGAVYAVLVMARLSPIGPALAGFVFLAASAWPLVDPATYDRTVDAIGARFKILGVEILGIDLAGKSGVTILLAIPLIATLTSARRWSRYADRPAAEVAYYGQNTGYQQAYRYAAQTQSLDPVTEQLPDVSPPTLHYPRSSSAAAPAPVRPEPPAPPTVVLSAPAPAAPAPAPAAPAPAPAASTATPASAPAAPAAKTPEAKPEPAKPEPAKPEAAEPEAPKPEAAPAAQQTAPAEEPDSDATVRINPDMPKSA